MKYINTNPINLECITFTQANIIYNSRLFWRELVFWARAFFDSVFFGVGNSQDVFRELFNTPNRYASTLRFILGRQTADKYAFLFNQYVINLRELVRAAEVGDMETVDNRVANLFDIVKRQAEFFVEIFPTLDEAALQNMLEDFTILLIEEINSYILLDYSAQIEIFQRIINLTDSIADYLSFGIIDLITAAPRFRSIINSQEAKGCITFDQFNIIMEGALFWVSLITWFREYRLSVMADLGNQEALYNKLMQTITDYQNMLKAFFDEDIVNSEIELIREYIDLLNELLNARLAGDYDKMNQTFLLIMEGITERGTILNENIPLANGSSWTDQLIRLNTNLINMTTQFLTGDYSRSIEIFKGLIAQAEDMGSALTETLVELFIQGSLETTAKQDV